VERRGQSTTAQRVLRIEFGTVEKVVRTLKSSAAKFLFSRSVYTHSQFIKQAEGSTHSLHTPQDQNFVYTSEAHTAAWIPTPFPNTPASCTHRYRIQLPQHTATGISNVYTCPTYSGLYTLALLFSHTPGSRTVVYLAHLPQHTGACTSLATDRAVVCTSKHVPLHTDACTSHENTSTNIQQPVNLTIRSLHTEPSCVIPAHLLRHTNSCKVSLHSSPTRRNSNPAYIQQNLPQHTAGCTSPRCTSNSPLYPERTV
jgi:hypothetical protein